MLVNKPEVFRGSQTESLYFFIERMDLYILQILEEMKQKFAVSFLADHAFDWYKVVCNFDEKANKPQLKTKLQGWFQFVSKVKAAIDKLAVWKTVTSVALFNESFLKIIIHILNISQNELIDRYVRGLKTFISQEPCMKTRF